MIIIKINFQISQCKHKIKMLFIFLSQYLPLKTLHHMEEKLHFTKDIIVKKGVEEHISIVFLRIKQHSSAEWRLKPFQIMSNLTNLI